MIVTCPSCQNKYSVQAAAIGDGKLVRCVICGATWRQMAIPEVKSRKNQIRETIKWTFFWSVVFCTLFFLFFAKSTAIKIWPPMAGFYETVGMLPTTRANALKISNISNFLLKKDGKLMIGLKGELLNLSNEVQILPSITISLRNDDRQNNKNATFKKIWTHDMQYRKILPNQKVFFETEPQSVPCGNLICDIKLDVL